MKHKRALRMVNAVVDRLHKLAPELNRADVRDGVLDLGRDPMDPARGDGPWQDEVKEGRKVPESLSAEYLTDALATFTYFYGACVVIDAEWVRSKADGARVFRMRMAFEGRLKGYEPEDAARAQSELKGATDTLMAMPAETRDLLVAVCTELPSTKP